MPSQEVHPFNRRDEFRPENPMFDGELLPQIRGAGTTTADGSMQNRPWMPSWLTASMLVFPSQRKEEQWPPWFQLGKS